MASVSVHSELAGIANIEKLAVGVALFFETGLYPDFMGHYGGFEQNHRAVASNLSKFHIALITADFKAGTKGQYRASDNFLICVNHFFEPDYYQILDILTPEAHARINTLLPHYIELAECYHALPRSRLNNLTNYTGSHEIAKQIALTE